MDIINDPVILCIKEFQQEHDFVYHVFVIKGDSLGHIVSSTFPPAHSLVLLVPVCLLALCAAVGGVPAAPVDGLRLAVVTLEKQASQTSSSTNSYSLPIASFCFPTPREYDVHEHFQVQ